MSAQYDDEQQKYVLQKRSYFDSNWLPIIQNLTAQGFTEAEIGAVVGYQGENTGIWISNLMQANPEVKDALKTGRRIADANLVANMYHTAVGYDYEEVEEIETPKGVTIKRKLKHQPGSPQMQIFLACNHMPELYKNRVETTKRGFTLNTNVEISGEQIEKLAGKLLDTARQVKQIQSKVVETDNGDN
jgi:hypothetical protein